MVKRLSQPGNSNWNSVAGSLLIGATRSGEVLLSSEAISINRVNRNLRCRRWQHYTARAILVLSCLSAVIPGRLWPLHGPKVLVAHLTLLRLRVTIFVVFAQSHPLAKSAGEPPFGLPESAPVSTHPELQAHPPPTHLLLSLKVLLVSERRCVIFDTTWPCLRGCQTLNSISAGFDTPSRL